MEVHVLLVGLMEVRCAGVFTTAQLAKDYLAANPGYKFADIHGFCS